MIVVCVDSPRYDGVDLCERLQSLYPRATLVGLASCTGKPEPGPLFIRGIRNVLALTELDDTLRALVEVVSLQRGNLLEGLSYQRVSERLLTELGPELARYLGYDIPPPPVVSADEMRKQMLQAALATSGDNRTEAARLLKVSRTTVHRWIKELGLDRKNGAG